MKTLIATAVATVAFAGAAAAQIKPFAAVPEIDALSGVAAVAVVGAVVALIRERSKRS